MKSKLPRLSILTKKQKKKKEKNDQIGTQATDCVTRPGSGETNFLYHGSLLAVKPITELWFPL